MNDKNRITNFRDLRVWQAGMELVTDCYKITGHFPAKEQYGLNRQLRRAAVSVPANIAEGRICTTFRLHLARSQR